MNHDHESHSDPQQGLNVDKSIVEGQVSQAGRDSTQIQGSGRILKDITINVFNKGDSTATHNAQGSEKLRLRLLVETERVVGFWLDKYLGSSALIDLLKEERLDLVNRQFSPKLNPNSKILFPPRTSIVDIFNQKSIAGKLMILGHQEQGKPLL